MPCGWGVKAGMVRFVWGWQIKLCGYTRAISERFRDHLGIIKRYTNGLLTLLYLLYYRKVHENVFRYLESCRRESRV